MALSEVTNAKIWRDNGDSIHISNDFEININDNTAQQYYKLYQNRLKQLKPKLKNIAKQKYPNSFYCDRIFDVSICKQKDIIIIGTLFKDMSKKINILDELTSV